MNFIRSMDFEAYRKLDGVNWSTLREMRKSPMHYRHRLTNPMEDTDQLKFGRVSHIAVHEPELFQVRCAIWKGGPRRGKKWDAFESKHEGLEIITEAQAKRALAFANAVRSDSVAAKYVSGGKSEQVISWTHHAPAVGDLPAFSILMKGRLDFVADIGALSDLKSTRDVTPEAFGRSAWNLGYVHQAAVYRDGYHAVTGKWLPYFLVGVEAEAPHATVVYEIPEWQLELGRETYAALLSRLHECRESNIWPGPATETMQLALPNWATGFSVDEDATDMDLDTEGLEEAHG